MRILLIALIMSLMSSVSYARDQISIVGSSTVYPFATVVSERFGKSGFKTPVIESTGTGGCMKLFCKGIGVNSPDMTNASRAIKSSEVELCKKNGISLIRIPHTYSYINIDELSSFIYSVLENLGF